MQRSNVDKELSNYYNDIKKQLPINNRAKKKFISNLKVSIEDYYEINENATLVDIREEFGTPESIVIAFMEQESSEDTLKRASHKRKFYSFIIISVIILLLVTSATYIYVIYDTYNTNHGYFVDEGIEEITIEE